MPVMRRGSNHRDALVLAPPFSSPRQESLLQLSDEHAVPLTIGESVSLQVMKRHHWH